TASSARGSRRPSGLRKHPSRGCPCSSTTRRARPPTPIASWRRRCSRMASGKRASMREGPLAALFRRTDEAAPATHAGERPPQEEHCETRCAEEPTSPPAPSAPRTPTPQERLRHAFSSDLPENMMAPPEPQRPSASEYQWESTGADITRQPELRVVGVGGGGV